MVAVGCAGGHHASESVLPNAKARQVRSAPSGYDAAVLALQPYAYYRLDETSGTVAVDSSGNGHNGTYHGTSGTHYLLGQTSIVPGLASTAKFFAANAGAPKVTLPTVALGANGSTWTDFSISLWAKPDPSQLAQSSGFYEINEYYAGQYSPSGNSTSPYMGAYPTGNWYPSSGSGSFADGKAHFITETVHKNITGSCDLSLYFDGVLTISAAGTGCTGNQIFGGSNAGIAARLSYSYGAAGYFGQIGGVALFTGALSATQVANLYNGTVEPPATPSPTPTPEPGSYDAGVMALSPYAYYRLDETSGTTAVDSSGNGRNGTYQGTVGTHYLLGQGSIVPGLTYTAKFYAANAGAPKVKLPTVALGANGSTWTDFSVSLWAKPDPSQLAQSSGFYEINEYYAGQYSPSGNTTSPYMGAYPTGNWYPNSGSGSFADGNAHFIAETVHKNTAGSCDLSLYFDGVLRISAPGTGCTGNQIFGGTNAGIAARLSYSYGAGGYFGQIGGVALYAQALTATQIANLYNGSFATPAPTPTPTPTVAPAAVVAYPLSAAPYRYAELGDGRVIIETIDSNPNATMSLLDPSTGTITTLETLANHSGDSIASGTDGQVWVGFSHPQTSPDALEVRRYSATGANVDVTLSGYSGTVSLAGASDQRMFVTGGDGSGNCIFNTVDTSGNVVAYPANTVCGPLIRGSDNGMWALSSTTSINRYSIADFSTSSYSAPAPGPYASNRLSGVPGQMMGIVEFTRVNTTGIDSVTTAGVAGPYQSVQYSASRSAEGFGPDGSYWTVPQSGQLCRTNPSTGAYVCYGLGSIPDPQFLMQAGSQNRLWFVNGTTLYKLDVSSLGAAP